MTATVSRTSAPLQLKLVAFLATFFAGAAAATIGFFLAVTTYGGV
jgi:hypothetical protein